MLQLYHRRMSTACGSAEHWQHNAWVRESDDGRRGSPLAIASIRRQPQLWTRLRHVMQHRAY